jgi:hypothetical protein
VGRAPQLTAAQAIEKPQLVISEAAKRPCVSRITRADRVFVLVCIVSQSLEAKT